ncbi:MFS transporter [Kribbella sp. NPDC056861]|uniref:MFS transporter n=1 Tax=Kribbella sp. NPDC056861 TaxID=3154857 RepID=UPI00341774BF
MTTVTSGSTAVWRNRRFRRIWLASSVSFFGSEIAELALPLLALVTLSATAQQVGFLRMAQFLPFLVATLPLGVLVDRRRSQRLTMMVTADLGRFLLVAAIPAAIWLGVARIEVLYGLVFCAGILTVLYQLADFAFLPSVVEGNQLVEANGKISASQSASEIGGRGIGGLLVQTITAPVAVAANAASFLISGLALAGLRNQLPSQPVDQVRPETGSGLTAGLRAAASNRYIRALLGEAATFNLFNELFILGLLVHSVHGLGLGPAEIGLVFTAGGIGSFAGAWFGSRFTARFGYGRVLLTTLILGNTAPLGVLLAGPPGGAALAVLSAVFVVMGVGIGIANSHAVTLRQIAVPEQLRGRVNAAYRLVSWGVLPAGAGAGGLLATRIGAHPTMIIGAIGVTLATAWVAFSPVPHLRRIDDAAQN